MLYEDEKPFDGVTGQERTTVLEKQSEAVEAEQVLHSESLEALSISPGWKLIKAAMQHDIAEGWSKLLHSRNYEHTREIQEFVKARQGLLNWIDSKILEGKTLINETTQARR